MPAPRKYSQELRARSLPLVSEAMAEDSSLSLNQAVKRIGERVRSVSSLGFFRLMAKFPPFGFPLLE
jgi:hypothetical protein